jgi:amidase
LLQLAQLQCRRRSLNASLPVDHPKKLRGASLARRLLEIRQGFGRRDQRSLHPLVAPPCNVTARIGHMSDPAFKSAIALASDLKAGKIGCAEALEHFWSRVERFNPEINAIVVNNIEQARTRARAADAAISRGESWGPLHGVPITVKESFDVVGTPTTWGLPAFKDNFPVANAVVVDRLLNAGAVVFAKTNVPALLADWQTYNAIYGTTNNPWNFDLSPGGSSGGSAAALAAGLTALDAGSDIGGSIRNPAHYCGVYGHKPTPGLVPMRGQLFPGNVAPVDFFVSGPMARSAEDLAAALAVMAGPDLIEAAGWHLALRPSRTRTLADFKVGLILDDPNSRVDREVQDRLCALASFLAKHGAIVNEQARPEIDLNEAHEIYVRLLRAATSRSQTTDAFQRNLMAARSLDASDRSYFARMVRGNAIYHKDWLDADESRHRMRHGWLNFFADYDLLLSPAAASAACPHDHAGERYQRTILVDDNPVPCTDQLFWAGIATLPGLPATVAPIGLTPRGLPVGVQIVGGFYDDLSCVEFARLLQREYYAFVPPPRYGE